MIIGQFVGDLPFIDVNIAWERAVQTESFILDTGFTGCLQVTYEMARNLNLNPQAVMGTKMADGSIVNMPYAVAIASMEGVHHYMEVMIGNGDPLAGIKFLSQFDYRAIIDCKNKKVILERVN